MREKFFSTKNITTAAVLTAISYVLYMFVKFPLPFMFPAFLDIQFSEMPAMLAGFMMGPIWGCIVIILKCLLKMPFTSTACVGEVGDLIMGVALVLVSSLIYRKFRTKKGAVLALVAGTLAETVVAMLVNRFMLIPFFVKVLPEGWDALVGMLSSLFPSITRQNFYLYYIFVSVLPFNILRLTVCSVITFFVYKHLHRLVNKMFAPHVKKEKESSTDNIAVAASDSAESDKQ